MSCSPPGQVRAESKSEWTPFEIYPLYPHFADIDQGPSGVVRQTSGREACDRLGNGMSSLPKRVKEGR